MSKLKNLNLTNTILCVALAMMFFSFQSCQRDQSIADLPESLGISGYDNQPTWSPDGSKIVFKSSRSGGSEIYTMNADGTNQIRLTRNTLREGNPDWSPDGSKIVFDSNRVGNWEIYMMNTDGSEQTRLTDNPANEGMPDWSPDCSKIVFYSSRDGNVEIYSMNADGSNQIRLTDNPAVDGEPSWSPDGNRIVFHSNRDKNWEIYSMNIDGSDQRRLTDDPSDDLRPTWSPDGTKIIFDSDRAGLREIFSMNVDGSDPIRLTYKPRNYYPSWSPDGKKIVFESDKDLDEEVYVMDADGSNPVNLTKNAPVNATFGLAPLPKSELDLDNIPYKLVFQSYRETDGKENWEICLIDADGSNLVNLTNTPDVDERYPHASPNGQHVVFESHEGESEENRIRNVYTMNIDGTDRVKIAENAYQPCWGPDGRYIAYLPGEYPRYNPRPYANKGIAIYDRETGEVKRHPNEKIQHILGLCWSPDGEWFVAAGGRPGIPGRENAFKVNDKTMMNLTIGGCTPDISADGRNFAWNGTDYSLNIGKLDFDSPESSVTEHKMAVACDLEHWVYHADWSPDGRYLAFTYGFDDEGKPADEREEWSHVCICDLETGKWTQITSGAKYNGQPDWVPVQFRRP
jgi:Tol biopolymer transport system component